MFFAIIFEDVPRLVCLEYDVVGASLPDRAAPNSYIFVALSTGRWSLQVLILSELARRANHLIS